jgi:ribosomal protein S12 methylthiotransferase accessory factor YcaO
MEAARYQAVLEQVDRYGRKMRDITLECQPGKKPTIADFVEAFRREGLELELTDFPSMTFKPVDPVNSPVISLRVVRTVAVG